MHLEGDADVKVVIVCVDGRPDPQCLQQCQSCLVVVLAGDFQISYGAEEERTASWDTPQEEGQSGDLCCRYTFCSSTPSTRLMHHLHESELGLQLEPESATELELEREERGTQGEAWDLRQRLGRTKTAQWQRALMLSTPMGGEHPPTFDLCPLRSPCEALWQCLWGVNEPEAPTAKAPHCTSTTVHSAANNSNHQTPGFRTKRASRIERPLCIAAPFVLRCKCRRRIALYPYTTRPLAPQ